MVPRDLEGRLVFWESSLNKANPKLSSACRQATGGLKGSNRDSLVF